MLLSIEGAGAKHNNLCEIICLICTIGQYIFILCRLELVLLPKITIQTHVGVVEESGTEGEEEEVKCCSLWEKHHKESTSCTHVSKASRFCLCSSRYLVEEGKLAAKTNIEQVVKMCLHLCVVSALTPPCTAASAAPGAGLCSLQEGPSWSTTCTLWVLLDAELPPSVCVPPLQWDVSSGRQV